MDRIELREQLSGKRLVRQEGDGLEGEFSEFAQTIRPEGEEEHTRQSEADAADINKIVARFEKSGIVPMLQREGVYADVSEVGDYRHALEEVEKARGYFNKLPAESRAIFDNDVATFLDAVNANKFDMLARAGIIPKEELADVSSDAVVEKKDGEI